MFAFSHVCSCFRILTCLQMFALSPEIVLRDISIRCCMAWRSSLSFTLIVEDSDSLNTMARHSKKTAKKMKGALADTEFPQVESALDED